MTEAEWLSCTYPQPMLSLLRGKASDRKLRLFAVACCRRTWPLLADEQVRKAVGAAERYADGRIGKKTINNWCRKVLNVRNRMRAKTSTGRARWMATDLVFIATYPRHYSECLNYYHYVINEVAGVTGRQKVAKTEREAFCNMLRCIFGSPFRPVAVDPSWLAWSDGTVGKLAQTVYDERAFDRLPILADALEEAGCTNADILNHCRQPGEHVRGCWVIDLILGKG